MRRSIFKAGVWTALGLAIAFAVVSANSNTRHAATTSAKAAKATVATAASNDECTSSDVCCAKKVNTAAVAVAPRKAVKKSAPVTQVPGSAGMIVGIDPETGQVGPASPDQARDLASRTLPVEAQVTETVMPDGSVRLNLNGTAVEYATVKIDANGKKTFGCTSDKPVAPAAAPTLEEK